MKSLFAAIALVAACSVANAAEVKKDIKAPVVASKAMTDTDMDKVTAGAVPGMPGYGIGGTACSAGGTCEGLPSTHAYQAHVTVTPGFGLNTR